MDDKIDKEEVKVNKWVVRLVGCPIDYSSSD